MLTTPRTVKIAASTLILAGLVASITQNWAAAAEPSAALKQVIEAAKKEGKLEVQWGSSLLGGNNGVRELAAGMNAMFGTDIAARFTPGPSLPQMINKVVVAMKAGRPSPTDPIIGTNQHAAMVMQRGAAQPVDWKALLPGRITNEMIEARGLAVRIFTTLPGGIIYNTKTAPKRPDRLSDLLDPIWKGKIASTPYAASFELFSASDVWGEKKALDFARKLSHQVAGLIRCSDLERVASGEFQAFAMDCTGRSWEALKRNGAPIDYVVPRDFAAQRFYYMTVAKNAAHPNAAKLFAVFLLTPEGQRILWKHDDTDLHTFPDSQMSKVVKAYQAKGIAFRQFTVDWYLKHPEARKTQRAAVKILRKR